MSQCNTNTHPHTRPHNGKQTGMRNTVQNIRMTNWIGTHSLVCRSDRCVLGNQALECLECIWVGKIGHYSNEMPKRIKCAAFNQLTGFYFRIDFVHILNLNNLCLSSMSMLDRRLRACVFPLLPFICFISSSIRCTNSKFPIRLNNNNNNHRAEDNDWPRLKRSYWLFIQIKNLLL